MTPLERAARAVYKVSYNGPYGPEDEDAAWRTQLDAVRAVLTAIREPSEAMDRAAAECESSYVGDVFTAMIDAALAEGE